MTSLNCDAQVYAMKKLGYKGTVYASTLIASAKEDALRRRGAKLVKYGTDCVDAENKARQVAQVQLAVPLKLCIF